MSVVNWYPNDQLLQSRKSWVYQYANKSLNIIKYDGDNNAHLHFLSFLRTFSLLVSNLRRKCTMRQISNITSSSLSFHTKSKLWYETQRIGYWFQRFKRWHWNKALYLMSIISSSPHFATTGSYNSWQSCGGDLFSNNKTLKKEMTTQRDQDVHSNKFPCCVFCI